MKIDAHHHLWHPARSDYDWMPDIDILQQPYTPADLEPQLAATGIDGTVLIQAAASIEETEYMLGLADATPWIKGVVGWIDFDDRMHLAHLRRLARHPRFIGVRPMIQDIEDTDWMLRHTVQWAYKALVDLDLSFDILGSPRHIAPAIELAQRHPDLRIVCDHLMKPPITEHQAGQDVFSDWSRGISALAAETHVVMKLSSLLTEASPGWTLETVRPFADHAITSFGADRLMWGSDWPVSRLTVEYSQTHKQLCELTSHLKASDREKILGGTAARFYKLQ